MMLPLPFLTGDPSIPDQPCVHHNKVIPGVMSTMAIVDTHLYFPPSKSGTRTSSQWHPLPLVTRVPHRTSRNSKASKIPHKTKDKAHHSNSNSHHSHHSRRHRLR